ncbi:thiamine phosphate synthase [Lentibacter sp. XHP0401]|jgi:thiamine-phosphate pyrophosphorylase|uniref:thiamine phosphate synthase n=1 Tax=Lentibacter sp. XHP0401 TaxID=2984334 RepID=UPI0021E9AB73|nr:thiamine phosphate synthase [Lentibacter sp. XHP0401]MCV2892028.1 thiamine phosphate synthase [Lentibacter sp. XHP0401]
MAEEDKPQIYLITPPEIELGRFPSELAKVLDTHAVACVRLALATHDEDTLSRAVDALREVTVERDVALVVEKHILLVERLGLDGVHLTDGARSVAKARKALGQEAIVGSFCGNSRHDGMAAGEAGADYVCFGPIGATALGDGTQAEYDLLEWWSQVIEVPVVAEGALDEALITQFAPVTDFFGIGSEIWSKDNPTEELTRLIAAMA